MRVIRILVLFFLLLEVFSGLGAADENFQQKNTEEKAVQLAILKKCLYWEGRNFDSLKMHSSRLNGEFLGQDYQPYFHFIQGRVETSAKSKQGNLETAVTGGLKIGDAYLTGLSHYRIGRIYSGRGSYDSALGEYLNAHKFLGQEQEVSLLDSERGKCLVYNSQAFISNQLNDYTSSVEYSLSTLRIAEKNQHDDLRLSALINLSAAYGELGSPDNRLGTQEDRDRYSSLSKIMMLEAANLAERLGDRRKMHRTLSNLGIHYGFEDKIDSSKIYLTRAVKIGEEIKDRRGLINDYNMLSLVYKKIGKIDSAVYVAGKAIENAKAISSPRMETRALISLAELAMVKDEIPKARALLNQAIDLTIKFPNPKSASHAYDFLYQIAEKRGEHEQALAHYRNAVTFRDSVASGENFNRIEELKITFETEKKEQQIKNLEQEAVIANLKIDQQSLQLLGALLILVIGAVAGYAIYRNRNLQTEQQRLVVEQKLLRSQMNPHFLFNALSSVHGYIYEGDKKQASEYLSMFSELTRDILNYSTEELIPISKELETLEKYAKLQQLRFPQIAFEVQVQDGLEPSELCIPPMLLQPFVENAIEHGLKGQEEGDVMVKIGKGEGDEVLCQIRDNGIGLIANENSEHQSKATEIARERISLLPGMKKKKDALNVRNQENGVLVELKFPMLDWV